MEDDEIVARVLKTPVVNLNFGDTRLRRRLALLGVDTFEKLLNYAQGEMDSNLSLIEVRSIERLADGFERDSVATAERLLSNREHGLREFEAAIFPKPIQHNRFDDAHQQVETSASHLDTTDHCSSSRRDVCKKLNNYQNIALKKIEELTFASEEPLVYQTFPAFPDGLDELNDLFIRLFAIYRFDARKVLALIDKSLGDAFLVFVANRARLDYDGDNLWGNLFHVIGLEDSNIQNDFKRLFVSKLEIRHLPVYAKDEVAYCYYYTALLHGGLSESIWESLWSSSLIPMAKDVAKENYDMGFSRDGRTILRMIGEEDSKYRPKLSVLNLFEKVSKPAAASLLEQAFDVVQRVNSAQGEQSSITIVPRNELPEDAMRALAKSTEKSKSVTAGHRRKSSSIVYIPPVELELNVALGVVELSWDKQKLPSDLAGSRMDVYVGESLCGSSQIEGRANGCVLNATTIKVAPQDYYDIELRLVKPDVEDDKYQVLGSMRKSFSGVKPHCFEFIQDRNDRFFLRKPGQRIASTRRVAYLTSRGCSIKPGTGMKPVVIQEMAGSWDESVVCIFDVEPGSTGSLVDLSSGEVLAAWHESYPTQVDRRFIIGKTTGGLDLYGFVPARGGINIGLPYIYIESFFGERALNDLKVSCIVDGRRTSIKRRLLWEDIDDSHMAKIELFLSDALGTMDNIGRCEIEVRQKSNADDIILKYKFAVVPIKYFHPVSIFMKHGRLVTDYQFIACKSMEVKHGGQTKVVRKGVSYEARALLKDEWMGITISAPNSLGQYITTGAQIALAAIDVKLSDTLQSIVDEGRPATLADALDGSVADGLITLTCTGHRFTRQVYVSQGNIPLFFKDLAQPGMYSFSVFSRRINFVSGFEEPTGVQPVKMEVLYGDDPFDESSFSAVKSAVLLKCLPGFGFSSWNVSCDGDGRHFLKLNAPVICPLLVEIRYRHREPALFSVELEKGKDRLELPRNIVRALDEHRKLTIRFVPLSGFGDPEDEYATESVFER